MLRNKIVAHYKNHEVVKGVSNNFFPNKLFFNMTQSSKKGFFPDKGVLMG